ncbi:MAG: DUF4954 family protein, partial [Bacteroidetes bacterium]
MRNVIVQSRVSDLGYNFIAPQYLPEGKDEYYLRNQQNRSGITYKKLTASEIEILVRNGNTSDDWNNFLVSDQFNPQLVKNCKFFGLVRIGKLQPMFLEFSDLKVPVGLYNSTIISSDFGDNVVIDNVNYLSHYIIGSEVIVVNVNELATSNHAKFGNGIVKEGEEEAVRIWMEICNENGARSILPFNGMLPGDAYLWSKHRGNPLLLEKFKQFTEERFDTKRGYYGKIGDRTVIKNTSIIKDVWIGSDAYIKGANKLKNLTINSGKEGRTQIGESCELVNGIMGEGCRAFYGVKAVRFVMASHSQLKYGARLINSFLGNNATISCCEVLNSLIFPAHEQHHNNSFLTASTIMGQSNIAAGATIGSNHNSRGADGELVAGRGFWPALCVSLKHNAKFASFTILAKGDYPAELHIPFPFSLVSNDASKDELNILPAYWPMYNMYALARNTWKYVDRDRRVEKIQSLEYHYLAPDTVNEIFTAMAMMENAVVKQKIAPTKKKAKAWLVEAALSTESLEIEGVENSKRKVLLQKPQLAYRAYQQMILWYAYEQLIQWLQAQKTVSLPAIKKLIFDAKKRTAFTNVGGQLMPEDAVNNLIKGIEKTTIPSWQHIHAFYATEGASYAAKKLQHAMASLVELTGITPEQVNKAWLHTVLEHAVAIKTEQVNAIYESRKKDYTNTFRNIT